MSNKLKSVAAVLGGFLTVFILSSLTDYILEMIGIFPTFEKQMANPIVMPQYLLFIAFLYRSIYAVLGGFVAASLAPSNPMKHVTALGILGLIGGGVGVIAGWDLSEHWYPIALFVTAFPLVWLGGKLKVKSK